MREHPSSRIDFRSDTVTQPTLAMREAMMSAAVGDDVLGDDPTVIELQDRMASMFGKEAGLFIASGTMSNAIALRTHTVPGDEIVCDKTAHIYRYEGGGYAALCGASIALVEGEKCLMTADQVRNAIRKADGSGSHYPNGSLVCVETRPTLAVVLVTNRLTWTPLPLLLGTLIAQPTSMAPVSSMPPWPLELM
jgi:threonine aldolase